MELRHPICCGIDVHERQVTACLRIGQENARVRTDVREFPTHTAGLLELSAWLQGEGCPVVAMESTGVYWKPVYHILAGQFEVIVGNPRDIRNRPGHKTDKKDAQWIAELLAHDLVRPSFVPPPYIQALRDLTRTRTILVQIRASAKNRVLKVLEEANIKLPSVASDVFGKSGRAMLAALIAGERDAKKLAQLAKGLLRKKIDLLELALTGAFTEHHAALIRIGLEQIELLSRQVDEIDQRIGLLVEPLRSEIERVSSIPGVGETAARVVLAEIGTDMERFGSDARLASWAGLCPGNNESAGKRYSGRTRKANRHLRRILAECAWATRKTRSFLGETFRRLQARLGGKKAVVAVAHKILVIVYHVLRWGTRYEEQRYERHQQKEGRELRRALSALQRLGYRVELQAADPQREALAAH